jgi:hypothetical protein
MPETEWVPFRIAKESVGPEQDPEAKRPALLYVVGIVSGGMMHWRWLYSKEVHKRSSIKQFAEDYLDELRTMIASIAPEEVSSPYERFLESPFIQRFRSRKPGS